MSVLNRSTLTKGIVILAVAVIVVLFFAFDLQQHFTLENLKSQQTALSEFYADNTLLTLGIYVSVYVVMAALSLPGAAVMTMAGGALLGLWVGTAAALISSTLGATLAFVIARFVLGDYVQRRFSERLKKINEGVRRDGAFYLFTLRLVPVFPFFVINIAMALTPIRTRTFFLVSLIGMLPGGMVYVNAGRQLSQITSAGDILSPGLIGAFVLLGVFPWIAKVLITIINRRRALAGFRRPRRCDYNMVVVGAGSAGLVTAYIAATVRARVALIEKERMGGDCLNTGCVPSKALIRSAKMLHHARRAEDFGFRSATIDFDFAGVMQRVHKIIGKIAPHDSVERYTGLGVDCIQGEARVISPWEVQVNGKTLTTRTIVIATGAGPFVPPIEGLAGVDYLTSDSVWDLTELPDRLVVLGGGPIGCELSQAFARLGSDVTQVEMGPQLMGREDTEVASFVRQTLETDGVTVLTGHTATAVKTDGNEHTLICMHNGRETPVPFDRILVAVGRQANTRGFGLEDIGVAINDNSTLKTDETLRTTVPTIYGAGDAVGPYQFTHVASHQAWHASVNALFGRFKSFKVDYRVIPWTTYTDPEVARVGINETDAAARNIEHEVTRYSLDELDRAITDSADHGFVKVLTKPGSDKILGVTIVGAHAGELIAEFILAMKHNLGLNKILGTIHVYPTLAEANRFAAGEWKKARKPERVLSLVERFLRWQR
ncbi:MAG: FAD-dependent oxidoreductase [Thermodesulfobacteriota bacterium]|nr:FAD-dependent oxidoreductase [Thermodesulfobacteriota bacterium]